MATGSSKRSKLLIGIAMAAAILCGIEFAVRAFAPHTGPALISPLSFQRRVGAIRSPGPESGTVLFGGPNIVTAEKPVGLRVFVYGGSATQGFHMSPWSAFPGWYQRLLRTLVPDPVVEVINLGAGGEGARQVVEVMRETAKSEVAHLFIVYSGNNEYYELRALKDALPGFDARTELARRRVSRFHLYRWLRSWIRPATALVASGEVRPVDSLDQEIDADERDLGVLFYRENLEAMVEVARDAGVPLLLSTVADHSMSYAFHGDPPPHSDGVDAALTALDGASLARDQAAIDRALATLEPLLQTQGDHHAVGQLLYRGQFFERAHPYFVEAEYLDPKPRRSNRAMRAVLKAVGKETQTPVCDAAAALSALSHGGISGEDVFFDPCHPNPLGHRRLGEILVRCTLEKSLLSLGADSTVLQARFEALIRTMPLAGADPFRLDHFTERRAQFHENRAMTVAEIDQTIQGMDDGTAEGAARAGHHAYLFDRFGASVAWYDRSLLLDGPTGPLQLSRGLVLKRLHDIAGARLALDVAVASMPEDPEVRQHRAVLGGTP